MNKYLIMLTVCAVTQRTCSKTIFDYNINPAYDLIAQESASFSNFWPSSEFLGSPHLRSKHEARGRGYGKGYGNRKHGFPEEYNDGFYHSSYFHHPHGIPPGQAKKYGRPHVIPPRFPPPPVYHKDFMNPWTLSATTPKQFIGQEHSITTPHPFIVQQPKTITNAVYMRPTKKITTITTPVPPSSTAADDQLMYDIDVRFGGE